MSPSARHRAFADRGRNRVLRPQLVEPLGVERVIGFLSPSEYLEFMRQAPERERMLMRSGTRLCKY